MTGTTGKRYPCPDCGSSDSLAIYDDGDRTYLFQPSLF